MERNTFYKKIISLILATIMLVQPFASTIAMAISIIPETKVQESQTIITTPGEEAQASTTPSLELPKTEENTKASSPEEAKTEENTKAPSLEIPETSIITKEEENILVVPEDKTKLNLPTKEELEKQEEEQKQETEANESITPSLPQGTLKETNLKNLGQIVEWHLGNIPKLEYKTGETIDLTRLTLVVTDAHQNVAIMTYRDLLADKSIQIHYTSPVITGPTQITITKAGLEDLTINLGLENSQETASAEANQEAFSLDNSLIVENFKLKDQYDFSTAEATLETLNKVDFEETLKTKITSTASYLNQEIVAGFKSEYKMTYEIVVNKSLIKENDYYTIRLSDHFRPRAQVSDLKSKDGQILAKAFYDFASNTIVYQFTKLIEQITETEKITVEENLQLDQSLASYTGDLDIFTLVAGTQQVVILNLVGQDLEDNRLVVKKVDPKGQALEGAKFALYNSADQKIKEDTTNVQGRIDFGKLEKGLYKIVEEEAPQGFEKTKDTYIVTVKEDGTTSWSRFGLTAQRANINSKLQVEEYTLEQNGEEISLLAKIKTGEEIKEGDYFTIKLDPNLQGPKKVPNLENQIGLILAEGTYDSSLGEIKYTFSKIAEGNLETTLAVNIEGLKLLKDYLNKENIQRESLIVNTIGEKHLEEKVFLETEANIIEGTAKNYLNISSKITDIDWVNKKVQYEIQVNPNKTNIDEETLLTISQEKSRTILDLYTTRVEVYGQNVGDGFSDIPNDVPNDKVEDGVPDISQLTNVSKNFDLKNYTVDELGAQNLQIKLDPQTLNGKNLKFVVTTDFQEEDMGLETKVGLSAKISTLRAEMENDYAKTSDSKTKAVELKKTIEEVILPVVNYPEEGQVEKLGNSTIIVENLDENNLPIVGSKYQISDFNTGEALWIKTSDINGKAAFIDLAPGEYLLEEIFTPEGYVSAGYKIQILVDENKNTSYKALKIERSELVELEPELYKIELKKEKEEIKEQAKLNKLKEKENPELEDLEIKELEKILGEIMSPKISLEDLQARNENFKNFKINEAENSTILEEKKAEEIQSIILEEKTEENAQPIIKEEGKIGKTLNGLTKAVERLLGKPKIVKAAEANTELTAEDIVGDELMSTAENSESLAVPMFSANLMAMEDRSATSGTNVNDFVNIYDMNLKSSKDRSVEESNKVPGKDYTNMVWLTSGDYVVFSANYKVDDSVHSGDYFTIACGDMVRPGSLQYPITISPLLDSQGETIATGEYDSRTNTIIFTFTDYVDKKLDVQGSFSMRLTEIREKHRGDKVWVPVEINAAGKIHKEEMAFDYGYKSNKLTQINENRVWQDANGLERYDLIAYINTGKTHLATNNFRTQDNGIQAVSYKFYQYPSSYQLPSNFYPKLSEGKLINPPQNLDGSFKLDNFTKNGEQIVVVIDAVKSFVPINSVDKPNLVATTSVQYTNGQTATEYAQVWNVYSREDSTGTGNGVTGKFILDKVNKQNVKLKGADFTLYKEGDSSFARLITTTGEPLSIGNLKPGTYKLVETKAPDGYTKTDEKLIVTVDAYGNTSIKSDTNPSKDISVNTETKTVLSYDANELNIVIAVENGYPSGTDERYSHYKITAESIYNAFKNTPGLKGKVHVILGGTLTKNTNVATFDIGESFQFPANNNVKGWMDQAFTKATTFFQNSPSTENILITLFEGAYTGLNADKALRELSSTNINKVFNYTYSEYWLGDVNNSLINKYNNLNINSNSAFANMISKSMFDENRDYYVSEYITGIAKDGTIKNVADRGSHIEENQVTVPTATISNGTFAKLIIKKTDKADNKELQGAVFTLTKKEGIESFTATSKEKGIATFDKIPPGEYILKETTAPDNYKKIDTEWNVYVSPTGAIFVNEKKDNVAPQEVKGEDISDKLTKTITLSTPKAPNGPLEIGKDSNSILIEGDFTTTDVKAGDYFDLKISETIHYNMLQPDKPSQPIIKDTQNEIIAVPTLLESSLGGEKIIRYTFVKDLQSVKFSFKLDYSVDEYGAKNNGSYDFKASVGNTIGTINRQVLYSKGVLGTDYLNMNAAFDYTNDQNGKYSQVIYVNQNGSNITVPTHLEITPYVDSNYKNGYITANISPIATAIKVYKLNPEQSLSNAVIYEQDKLEDVTEQFKDKITIDYGKATVQFDNIRTDKYVVVVDSNMIYPQGQIQGTYLAQVAKLINKDTSASIRMISGIATTDSSSLGSGSTYSSNSIEIPVPNEKAKFNFEFTKLNEESQPLENAEFSLSKLSDDGSLNQQADKKVVRSSADGKVKFTELDPGYYAIEETNTPEGYTSDGKSFRLVVQNDGTTFFMDSEKFKKEEYPLDKKVTKPGVDIDNTNTARPAKSLDGEITVSDYRLYRKLEPISTTIDPSQGQALTMSAKLTLPPDVQPGDTFTIKLDPKLDMKGVNLYDIVQKPFMDSSGNILAEHTGGSTIDSGQYVFTYKLTDAVKDKTNIVLNIERPVFINPNQITSDTSNLRFTNTIAGKALTDNKDYSVQYTRYKSVEGSYNQIGNTFYFSKEKNEVEIYVYMTTYGVSNPVLMVSSNELDMSNAKVDIYKTNVLPGELTSDGKGMPASYGRDKMDMSTPIVSSKLDNTKNQENSISVYLQNNYGESRSYIVKVTGVKINDNNNLINVASNILGNSGQSIASYSKTAQISSGNSSADATQAGEIKLIKKSEDGTALLPNAKFKLESSTAIGYIQTQTTNNQGELKFTGIKNAGIYTLTEVEAPTGYLKSEKTWQIGVYISGTTQNIYEYKEESEVTVDDSSKTITVTNKKDPNPPKAEVKNFPNEIQFVKRDQDGNAMTGVEFKLYRNETEEIKTIQSTDDGSFKFERLKPGNYKLMETKSLDEYLVPTQAVATFTVNKKGMILNLNVDGNKKDSFDHNNQYPIVNYKGKAEFSIKKTDESGQPLNGVKFILLGKPNESSVVAKKEATTSGEGIATFKDLPLDIYYYLKEVSTVSGYQMPENIWIVHINKKTDGKGYEVKIYKTDKLRPIVDHVDHPTLEGQYKEITKNGVDIVTGATIRPKDVNKWISQNPPTPIALDTGAITIKNPKGQIIVNKVDEQGNPLDGAEFTIALDGENYSETRTSQNGQVVFEKLTPGKTYKLTEKKSPRGYEKLADTWEISVGNNGEITVNKVSSNGSRTGINTTLLENGIPAFNLVNKLYKGKITIEKLDEKNVLLPGASFTLTNTLDTTKSQTVPTNTEGKIIFEGLEEGVYDLEETKAPEGYVATDTKWKVIVGKYGKVHVVDARFYNPDDYKEKEPDPGQVNPPQPEPIPKRTTPKNINEDVKVSNYLLKGFNSEIYAKPNAGEGLDMSFTLDIPDTAIKGDTFTVNLSNLIDPTGITDDIDEKNFHIVDNSGNTIATASYDKTSRTFTYTLTDYVEKFSNISVDINLPVFIDRNTTQNSGYVYIKNTIAGKQMDTKQMYVDYEPYLIAEYDIGLGSMITNYNHDTGMMTQYIYVLPNFEKQDTSYDSYRENVIFRLYDHQPEKMSAAESGVRLNSSDTKVTVYPFYKDQKFPESFGLDGLLQNGDIINPSFGQYNGGNYLEINFVDYLKNNAYVIKVETKTDKINGDVKNFTTAWLNSNHRKRVDYYDPYTGQYKYYWEQHFNQTLEWNAGTYFEGPKTGGVGEALAKFTVKKVNEKGENLNGAGFNLVSQEAGNDGRPIYNSTQITNDQTNEITFGNLRPGNYYLEEVKTPGGYRKPGLKWLVTVKDGKATITPDNYVSQQELVVTVKNVPEDVVEVIQQVTNYPNKIEFTKINTDRVPIKDKKATFKLVKVENGEESDVVGKTSTVGEDGKFSFEKIAHGSYKVYETIAPDGYIKPTKAVAEFDVDVKGKISLKEGSTYEIVNKKAEFDLTKVDENNKKKKLLSAEFQLYKKNQQGLFDAYGYLQSTDSDGQIHFKNIDNGIYKLKETKAPIGYKLGEVDKDGFIKDLFIKVQDGVVSKYTSDPSSASGTGEELPIEGTVHNLVITNKEEPMEIKIRKLRDKKDDEIDWTEIKLGKLKLKLEEAQNGQPKAGGKSVDFEIDLLFDALKNDKKVVLDNSKNWPSGEYILTETAAPGGYIKTENKYILNVNWETGTIRLIKVIGSDGKELKNSEGKLITDTGALIPEQVTGIVGQVTQEAGLVLFARKTEVTDTTNSQNTPTENIEVKLDIVNLRGLFPSTGGMGTLAFTLVGGALMTGATIAGRKKKREDL